MAGFFFGNNQQKMTPADVAAMQQRANGFEARGLAGGNGTWAGTGSAILDALNGVAGNYAAQRGTELGREGAKAAISGIAPSAAGAVSGLGGNDALVGALSQSVNRGDANSMMQTGRALDQGAAVSQAMSGGLGNPFASADPYSTDSASLSTGSDMSMSSRIRDGLIARGLPAHVADGFVMNFQDESGLDSGINERNPLVAGSRGGFGLAQWTGPRRRQLEAAAAARGVDPSDPDLQMDFLMQELQGSEAGAMAKIMNTGSAGEAGAAIVNSFLRPAEEHRASRAAKYLGGNGVTNGDYTGGASASYMGQPLGNGYSGPGLQDVAMLASDPWVAEQYAPVLQALTGQAQASQDFANQQRMAIFNNQLQQQDPAYQLGLQEQQMKIAAMQAPKAPEQQKLINAGDGQLYDPNTGAWITNPNAPDKNKKTGYQTVNGEVWDFNDGTKQPTFVGGGTQETVFGADGKPILQRGGTGGGKMTEGQGKDNLYRTRARGALTDAGASGFDVLANPAQAAAGSLPFGLGNYLQSDDYQRMQNVGNEFASAILRKDSGAALTEDEVKMTKALYLPVPGDKPGVLQQKALARERAVAAMETGMSTDQIIATDRANMEAWEKMNAVPDSVSGASQAVTSPAGAVQSGQPQGAPQPGQVEDGYQYIGGNPSDPNNWKKVQ